MNKVENFSINESKCEKDKKLGENNLMELVKQLGYNSIDEITAEKKRLAKLESVFKDMVAKGKIKNVSEGDDDLPIDDPTKNLNSGSGSSADTTSGSGNGSESGTGSDSGNGSESGTGSDSGTGGSSEPSEPTKTNVAKKIKSFAEFCGECDGSGDDDSCNEGFVTLKRKYTDAHPAVRSYENMKIRNTIMNKINNNGGLLVDEDLNTIFKSRGHARRWFKNNEKYINVKEDNGAYRCSFTKRGARLNAHINANTKAVYESEITSDEQFKEYAMKVLKKAHPDDFDEEKANKTIDGLKDKYKGDYGAMVGALTSSLGEEVYVYESEISSDEQFKEYAMKVLKKAHPDDFDEEKANKTIEGLKDKYKGDYGAMVGALTSSLGEEEIAEGYIQTDEQFEEYAMDKLRSTHPNNFDEEIARDVIDGLKAKYGDNYGAMVGALKHAKRS